MYVENHLYILCEGDFYIFFLCVCSAMRSILLLDNDLFIKNDECSQLNS